MEDKKNTEAKAGERRCTGSVLNYLLSDPSRIYKEALRQWGVELQVEMLVEECGELIAATNRMKRTRTSYSPWLEEIADVEIMIEQMRILHGEAIDDIKKKKLTRLAERTAPGSTVCRMADNVANNRRA